MLFLLFNNGGNKGPAFSVKQHSHAASVAGGVVNVINPSLSVNPNLGDVQDTLRINFFKSFSVVIHAKLLFILQTL